MSVTILIGLKRCAKKEIFEQEIQATLAEISSKKLS